MKKISLIFMMVQMGFLVLAETQNTDIEYRPGIYGYELYKKVWAHEQTVPYMITILGDTVSTELLNASLSNPHSLIPVARIEQPVKRRNNRIIPHTRLQIETQYIQNGDLLPTKISYEKDYQGGYIKIMPSLTAFLLFLIGVIFYNLKPKGPERRINRFAKLILAAGLIVLIYTLVTPPVYIVSTLFWTIIGGPLILFIVIALTTT